MGGELWLEPPSLPASSSHRPSQAARASPPLLWSCSSEQPWRPVPGPPWSEGPSVLCASAVRCVLGLTSKKKPEHPSRRVPTVCVGGEEPAREKCKLPPAACPVDAECYSTAEVRDIQSYVMTHSLEGCLHLQSLCFFLCFLLPKAYVERDCKTLLNAS